jgi:phosphoglycerate dehydrogenase-like enzyme
MKALSHTLYAGQISGTAFDVATMEPPAEIIAARPIPSAPHAAIACHRDM